LRSERTVRTVDVERELDCLAPPEVLWPLLADTQRVNRMAGMSPLDVQPIEGSDGARFLVRTRLDGFPVTYEEEPFEWQVPDHFAVRRVVTEGALHVIRVSLALSAGPDGGTHVRWRLSFGLKFAFLAPITRIVAGWRMNTLVAATRALDTSLRVPAALPVPPEAGKLARAAAALESAIDPEDRDLARRLAAWVGSAPDTDVLRIRPYELADAWGVPRDRLLSLCLEGVVAGLLEMHWDIVCPSCRTSASRVDHLFELGEGGHCGYCDIRFDLPLDRAVEAVFQPAPALRKVEERPYCTGGPASTPHVVAQAHLPVDGSARLVAPGTPGRYRVFVRGGATADVEVVVGAPNGLALEATGTLSPDHATLAPGGAVVVHQPGGVARHVKLEHVEWADRAATAHSMSLHPRFRRLFSGEVLGPGRQLRVGRVALLFSDLSDSTALYGRVGDAPAFRLVQDHFELLRTHVAAEGGVFVKTIGDAVMAAFPEEGAAVRAAVAMQASWDGFCLRTPVASQTNLKLGVHAGPAYVVTANGVLDYFGQTVNVAARLQGAAHAREIVVTEALAARATDAGWLGPARVIERFDAVLKGLDGPLRAARLVVPAA
jgi:class 3 adenylate cyclase